MINLGFIHLLKVNVTFIREYMQRKRIWNYDFNCLSVVD